MRLYLCLQGEKPLLTAGDDPDLIEMEGSVHRQNEISPHTGGCPGDNGNLFHTHGSFTDDDAYNGLQAFGGKPQGGYRTSYVRISLRVTSVTAHSSTMMPAMRNHFSSPQVSAITPEMVRETGPMIKRMLSEIERTRPRYASLKWDCSIGV